MLVLFSDALHDVCEVRLPVGRNARKRHLLPLTFAAHLARACVHFNYLLGTVVWLGLLLLNRLPQHWSVLSRAHNHVLLEVRP